jgi:hypothetical protein
MLTNGRTDMTKLIVTFSNSAKAPKNKVAKTFWTLFRLVRIVAKSAYQLPHIRLFGCVSAAATGRELSQKYVDSLKICLKTDTKVVHFTRRPAYIGHDFRATLTNFMLLTVTRNSIIRTQNILAFPVQQWLRKSVIMLRYTHIVYLDVQTLSLCPTAFAFKPRREATRDGENWSGWFGYRSSLCKFYKLCSYGN